MIIKWNCCCAQKSNVPSFSENGIIILHWISRTGPQNRKMIYWNFHVVNLALHILPGIPGEREQNTVGSSLHETFSNGNYRNNNKKKTEMGRFRLLLLHDNSVKYGWLDNTVRTKICIFYKKFCREITYGLFNPYSLL